jgi:DMSO/TMAO reductase YedYZ molybdopterin-dependent catalytic subunit
MLSDVAQSAQPVVPSAAERFWFPAAAGVASAALGVGAAEVIAGIFAPTASPILVVGSLVIDSVPGWVKDAVVASFGTNDKTFLLVCIGVVIAVVAGLAAVLESRVPPFGRVIFAIGGVIGIIAALTRTSATLVNLIPSAGGAIVAMILLSMLVKRLPRSANQPQSAAQRRRAALEEQRTSTSPPPLLGRRGFLAWVGGTAAIGVIATIGGQALQAGAKAVTAARSALKLPKPAKAVPDPVAADSFPIKGISPIVTPNGDFYRIDTALQVPQIDPESWELEITGMVKNPFKLTWAELLKLPMEESFTTLMCVSNEVGGDLISNAKWLGYPLRKLLARAVPESGADMVYSTSKDGWTASTPLQAVTDPNREAILAIGMNGQPLPAEHGFPVRMVVPGLYGYVSATKWVVKIDVTTYQKESAYWTDRGWSEKGPIKISSRIDVPQTSASVEAGNVVVAGVAWYQHEGIQGVDVQVDNGAWNPATLADAISIDTWRQWKWTWPATKGNHTLRVRATGSDGDVQTSQVADVVPNGSTGLHTIQVSVK